MNEFRPRIRSRLSADIYERLMVRADRPDMSVPKILDEALRSYFDGEVHEGRNAALLTRLERMSRHDHRQARDIAIIQEALALFVQYFFTVMPDQIAGDQELRAAKGVAHFNDFMTELSARMKGGGKNVKNALRDVLTTDSDYFSRAELEQIATIAGSAKTHSEEASNVSA